jgi:hypothetical protein
MMLRSASVPECLPFFVSGGTHILSVSPTKHYAILPADVSCMVNKIQLLIAATERKGTASNHQRHRCEMANVLNVCFSKRAHQPTAAVLLAFLVLMIAETAAQQTGMLLMC